MSTPNTRVAVMIAYLSRSSGGRHSNPTDNVGTDNVGTDGTISPTSGNISSLHGYLNTFFATGKQTPGTLILTYS